MSDLSKKSFGGEKTKKASPKRSFFLFFGGGRRTRTSDLWVMSPTSYHCSIPRYVVFTSAKVGSFFEMSKFWKYKKCEKEGGQKDKKYKDRRTGEQEMRVGRHKKTGERGSGENRRVYQEGRGQVKPAAVMASATAEGAAVPVTLTRPVVRSTVTVSTPGRERRVFSTVVLQWLQAIPFTL